MVSGVLLGILKQQHADYLVLGVVGAPIPLPAGLILERFDPGTLVTINYSRDSGGEMVIESMKRSRAFRPYSTR
jgi:hypothetical protein